VENYPIIELLVSGFQLLFGAFVPLVIISGSNIIIIITVKLASEKRIKMEAGQGQRKRANTDLTRMLVIVSLAYIVTSIPIRVYYLVMDIPQISSLYNMSDNYWMLRFNTQNEFLVDVWVCNYAINFYLYCVGGGQRYRRDTIEILRAIPSCFRKIRQKSNCNK
jgi:formate hydrogenlyase subunit 3/multisubunit Na+/H+ antiporter MnhD subunit